MKLISMVLALTLLLPGTAVADSTDVLHKIWSAYAPAERFSVYGGQPERAVQGKPAALDIRDRDALAARFCVPHQLLFSIEDGACMVHFMNRCVFSAVVFRLVENQDPEAFAAAVRGSLRNTKWENGRPERYLVMIPEGQYVLMAFGKRQLLDTFLLRTAEVFPLGRILHDEGVPI